MQEIDSIQDGDSKQSLKVLATPLSEEGTSAIEIVGLNKIYRGAGDASSPPWKISPSVYRPGRSLASWEPTGQAKPPRSKCSAASSRPAEDACLYMAMMWYASTAWLCARSELYWKAPATFTGGSAPGRI